jgi:MacB-like periplasmic core domain
VYRIVDPMYLNVMVIPLLAGREFDENDTAHTLLVCYINETLARRYFPAGNAVGSHLLLDDNDFKPRAAEVVGVIHDIKDTGLETGPWFRSTVVYSARRVGVGIPFPCERTLIDSKSSMSA